MSGLNQSINTIAKTTKLFINGEFPRTESGRSYPAFLFQKEEVFTHLCLASRKDLRSAVEAALAAHSVWSKLTAYNRAQILYRMAEMLEGKRGEFANTLQSVLGLTLEGAQTHVTESIDALLYYAGFADKYSQVTAAVNPVSGPFHNFTTPEPVGVVGLLYDQEFSLATFISQIASVICSGNSVVVVFDQPGAALLSELGEVFKTSDLPSGVINLLSAPTKELIQPLSQHMEVQSILCATSNLDALSQIKMNGVENMKRVVPWTFKNCDLSPIMAFTEAKTVWHPVGL